VKLTFEGNNIHEILVALESVLAVTRRNETSAQAGPVAKAQAPEPEPVQEAIVPEVIAPVDEPVNEPVEKPVDKMAKVRAAKKAKAKPAPEHPQEPFSDPADIVKLRQRTINDLQEAYANGHQAEVFELLSRFGNGAKSFRELPPDAFVPIREAIDSGALT